MMLTYGVTPKPFSAITFLPPADREKSYKKKIIEFSRKKYTKPRTQVEKEIIYKAPPFSSKSYDQRLPI